jgi:uncharacterized protein YbaA (DUF1428 family)
MAKSYIHTFMIPVPKAKLKQYRSMAKMAARTWMQSGALAYVEYQADFIPKGKITSFPLSVKLKAGETIVLGMVTCKSKAHCEKVMERVMKDEALGKAWDTTPFDGMRMVYGGFKTFLEA